MGGTEREGKREAGKKGRTRDRHLVSAATVRLLIMRWQSVRGTDRDAAVKCGTRASEAKISSKAGKSATHRDLVDVSKGQHGRAADQEWSAYEGV